MSSKNSWENKASARERLKAERARQAKRDKLRRQLIAGGAIVAALAIAGGVAVAVSNSGGSSKPLVLPANTSGPNGTTVIYGNKNAAHTLHLYEDARCPVCAMFEQADGKDVLQGVQDGRYKIQYTFGTFLDQGASPGTGSMHALSALGAALNVSPDAFIKFHTALYSQANHPEETQDKFSDTSYLFKISDQVPELKGNAAFQKAVKDGTYDAWAKKMSDSFNSSGVQATPTAKLDGKDFPVAGNDFPQTGVITPAQLAAAFDKALGPKK
ncbi:thioredoxin domain-containing protein [Streptantibioticus rubrisoli]|uniref:Thioredoxin domain-containing protein n=1 Tax=Streptantibioticus rubrisoli TaxID=1387313 RepID=A0ABT1PM94_9ACTN|nr:thioredoxin domain-containing protein [Streptantibioticus rubrisoli]MCQ4045931.1 thioredoxin domain-containing protein [Streptantibioticus rubrisoli]